MTESASRITVAVCARNAQDIIGDCLDSINGQTVRPDEVIVAMDDLADPTAEVARAKGARVIESKATGLYEARNAVLRACATEYLGFTDADCALAPEWVATARRVLDTRPEVAAGTGPHPPAGRANVPAWLHHMWFVVETERTGYVRDVIGGNSYFRVAALREVGGWLPLPGHSAAEDMYISRALGRAGHRVWFEEGAAARHSYETRWGGLWRKAVMMGRDIVVMLRAARWYDGLFWYTLAIPLLAAAMLLSLALAVRVPRAGLVGVAALLLLTYAFLAFKFRSPAAALPRLAARWVLIWPYSWGILQGLTRRVPPEARR